MANDTLTEDEYAGDAKHHRAGVTYTGPAMCGEAGGMRTEDPRKVTCLRCKGQKVMRADRSPLNPKRWCLSLECGCETWVTSARKPKQRLARCTKHG